MVNRLPIVLSGSALFFAVSIIVKYGKILKGQKPSHEKSANRILLYGPKPSDKVSRCWDVGRIIRFLKASKRTVVVCLTKLTNADLAAALIDIHKDKIHVRVILHGQDGKSCRGPLLQESGIEVKKVCPAQKLQHNFILLDGEGGARDVEPTVLIGVLDSVDANRQVYDSTLITTQSFVTNTLALEFNRLWEQF